MVAAALGGEFEVPTIDKGKTKVKVPAGTQSGRRFRIASKGMPVLRSRQTGDMYVQVMVETPQNLTKKQQELLVRVRKIVVRRHPAGSGGLLHQGQGLLRQPRGLLTRAHASCAKRGSRTAVMIHSACTVSYRRIAGTLARPTRYRLA